MQASNDQFHSHNAASALFCGTANPALGAAVAHHLGVELGAVEVKRFPDGEIDVQIKESVRGRNVFILQPTCPPVNEYLMELFVMADAFRRAAAGRIVAVIPYFGYARQDRRARGREPVTARIVADLLTSVGIDHMVAIDLHTPQIEGFFRIPVENLNAMGALAEYLYTCLPPDAADNAVVVAPDAGRVKTATNLADRLKLPLAIVDKRRLSSQETEVSHIVGDVRNRVPIIIDDMISTGGTVLTNIEALLKAGARPEVIVAATHALLVKEAVVRLGHEAIRELVITDTIPLPTDRRPPRLKIVSVAPLLAEALRRLQQDDSLQNLRDR